MKFNDNNILLKEWLERYNNQNESIKKELDRLHGDLVQGRNNNFQLLKIKRSYKYPEKGDIFVFQPRKNIFFYGLVLNAHVNNLQGEDVYVVALFSIKSKSVDKFSFVLDYSKLLLAPLMVDRIYWTKGLFYNVSHTDNLGTPPSYGFFKIARENQFWNEFDEPLEQRPEYLSSGAQTSIGVGYKVNKEIIIDDSLLRFE
ncbi:hypothetical protein DXA02_04265 [Ruminococcus sp. AM54-1NS]|jgi:hypothetical protein|nr:immunity 26/phosphotriesterase HocA family protein [Ruminococcus bicirculans (ex Wegman et al. 2014)]RGF94322.1 hypothetical protein DXA02_04265 [Ruminococcus sp. AM54-1NS]